MSALEIDIDDLVHTYGSTVGDHALRKIFRDDFKLPLTVLSSDEWSEMQLGIGPLVRYNLRRIYAKLVAREISTPGTK